MVDDLPVHSLIYADDLVLIARNRKDLQCQLDALDKFSKSLKMDVNMDKTKVMIIQKQKSRAKSKKIKLGRFMIKKLTNVSYINI